MGPLIHPICGLPLAMFSYGNTVSSIQICNMEVEKGENNTARKQWLLDFFNRTPYPLIDPWMQFALLVDFSTMAE